MTRSGLDTGAATWTERYETLRRCAVEGRQRLQSQPLGLALWVAKGMAGWMGHWTQWPTTALVPVVSHARSAEPGPWQQPLTVLLAQITLQHLEARVSL